MKNTLRILGPALGLSLFGLALFILHQEIREFRYRDVMAEIRAISFARISLSCACAALSYLLLGGYDFLGLRYAGRPLPYARTAGISFISYALSNNLGYGFLTGGLVRYRLYSALGFGAVDIARVAAFCAATFWAGMLLAGGWAFLAEPSAMPGDLRRILPDTRPLGPLFLVLSASYTLGCAAIRKPLRLGGWSFPLPGFGLGIAQQALGAMDWTVSAAVFHFLLPPGSLGLAGLVGIFILSQTLGLISTVPGGLGVFEGSMLLLLPASLPAPRVLGALMLYRVIYYLLPLFAGLVLFGAHELRGSTGRAREGMMRAGQWMEPAVPLAMAVCAFMSGLILLLSGATPAVPHRLRILSAFIPLPVLEASHFLGSLAGAALLILARGLYQRLDAAWLSACLLLSAGMALSLLKGGDYEEALLLGALLLVLLPARRRFHRKASLFEDFFSRPWLLATGTALGTTLWLGLFSYHHVAYSRELWWRFSLHGNASRFLRSAVGMAGLLLIFSLRAVLRPARAAPGLPTASDIDEAWAVSQSSERTYGNLVLLGDKRLLFSASRHAFIMYGVAGRSWVALGDPLGDRAEIEELLWEYKALCHRLAVWPAFYQVEAEALPLYLDLGFSLLKLGEEARVPLEGFSLEGHARKSLRQACARMEREGYGFEFIPAEGVPPLLAELRAVSDAWLRGKNTREKGFSLGRFDDSYLARNPVSVIRKEGRIRAFANVWRGAGRVEISVDLMRHDSDVPEGIMDFLFARLMLLGARDGFRWFNLGMAPLSGLEDRALAPAWNRLAGLIYRHGEHFYNFQGLRRYKEKFHPRWEPRYLASPGGWALPRILGNLSVLIAGGMRGVLSK